MHEPETCCFVDSNVWLYAFIEGGDAGKSTRARSIVQAHDAMVSTQACRWRGGGIRNRKAVEN
jgi:predicted nucleic acid-binding protein